MQLLFCPELVDLNESSGYWAMSWQENNIFFLKQWKSSVTDQGFVMYICQNTEVLLLIFLKLQHEIM